MRARYLANLFPCLDLGPSEIPPEPPPVVVTRRIRSVQVVG
jgi:hypothetical protein